MENLILNQCSKNLPQISNEIFISQPAITYRICKAEKFFDTELITRTNKEVQGKLHIGASSAIAQYLLPPYLSDFLCAHEEVKLNLVTGFSSYLLEELHSNRINIAFLREENEWGSHKKHLISDGIYIVAKEKIQLSDLPHTTLINYKTNFSLKNLIDNWWRNHFTTPPQSIIEVDNAEACKELVRAGLGYTILTGLTLNNQDDLYCEPLTSDTIELKRNVWMYANAEAMEYLTVRSFWEYISNQESLYHGK